MRTFLLDLCLRPAYDIDFTPREDIVAFAEAVRAAGEMG